MAQTRAGRPKQLVALGWIVAMVAIAYLCYLVWHERAAILDAVQTISTKAFVGAAICFAVMTLCKAAYHVLIVTSLRPSARGYEPDIAASFLSAQVLRYLPGKIWGVVYQAHSLGAICPPSVVVVANGVQMAVSSIVALLVAAALISANASSLIAWGFIAAAVMACLLTNARVAWLGAMVERLRARLARQPAFAGPVTSRPVALRATLILGLDWFFFLLGFVLLSTGLSTIWESIRMAGLYAGASTLATAALMVPAGIGVREALFVSAPNLVDQPASHLLLIGILARVTMLIGDVAAASIALVLRKFRKFHA